MDSRFDCCWKMQRRQKTRYDEGRRQEREALVDETAACTSSVASVFDGDVTM